MHKFRDEVGLIRGDKRVAWNAYFAGKVQELGRFSTSNHLFSCAMKLSGQCCDYWDLE